MVRTTTVRVLASCLTAVGCAHAACGPAEPAVEPIGEPNAMVRELEADGWLSSDTIVSVDPQTFAETTDVVERDLRPDTLADGTVVYELSEYLPVFAGCDTVPDPAICTQTRVAEFVSAQLRYPAWARARGVEGTAVATFVIGPDGRVRDTGIERSMGDELDRLVLEMVGRMPVWHPGFHGGRPVAVRYRLPVRFDLPEEG